MLCKTGLAFIASYRLIPGCGLIEQAMMVVFRLYNAAFFFANERNG
jgi:hypothetical protein